MPYNGRHIWKTSSRRRVRPCPCWTHRDGSPSQQRDGHTRCDEMQICPPLDWGARLDPGLFWTWTWSWRATPIVLFCRLGVRLICRDTHRHPAAAVCHCAPRAVLRPRSSPQIGVLDPTAWIRPFLTCACVCVCVCAPWPSATRSLQGPVTGSPGPRAQGPRRQDSGPVSVPAQHMSETAWTGLVVRQLPLFLFPSLSSVSQTGGEQAAATSRPPVLVAGERVEFGRARDEEDKVCACGGVTPGFFPPVLIGSGTTAHGVFRG